MTTFTEKQSEKMAQLLRELWRSEEIRQFWAPDLTEKMVVNTTVDNWNSCKTGAENAYNILSTLIGEEIIDEYIA